MNFGYGATNLFVEMYVEGMCLIISGLLLYLYYAKKINIFEVIFFALATFSGNKVSFADIRCLTTITVEEDDLFLRIFLVIFFFANGILQS